MNLCNYLFAADFIYLNVVNLILYLRYDPPRKGEKRRRAFARLFFHNFITFIMVILVVLVPSLKFCGLVAHFVDWSRIGFELVAELPRLCICNDPISICVMS